MILNPFTTRRALLSSSFLTTLGNIDTGTIKPELLPAWLTPTEKDLMPQAVASEGISLRDLQRTNYQRIIRDGIGDDASVVLIGEATHGTEEFYRIRADLTRALLVDGGFDAVLCEGDFPPFLQLNRFVTGGGAASSAHRDEEMQEATTSDSCEYETSVRAAMAGFEDRFPRWMWMNDAVADFATWLRDYNNSNRSRVSPVQMVGMDIYSLVRSANEVIEHLADAGEIEMAKEAKGRYAIFINKFRNADKESDYGRAVAYHLVPSQEDNASEMLDRLSRLHRRRRLPGNNNNGQHEKDELFFNAIMNAHAVAAAESYYRDMHDVVDKDDRGKAWNLREAAFFHAIRETMSYVERRKAELNVHHPAKKARVVVWAHNSHVGDASAAAEQAVKGEHSLGQMCRQAFGKDNCFIVGFTGHRGTVRAATDWDEVDSVMKLKPAMEGSQEYLLHMMAKYRGQNAFAYSLRSNSAAGIVDEAARDLFRVGRLERFVGVSYHPESEARSHYSTCALSDQFDCVIHVDRSSALKVDRVLANKAGGTIISSRKRSNNKVYDEKENMMLLDACSEDYGDLVGKKVIGADEG